MKTIKTGIIGFGRMGGFYLNAMLKSERWEVKTICEIDETRHDEIRQRIPSASITTDEDAIFNDSEIEVVVLSALADTRLRQIEKAVKTHKHIMAEKPIADSVENEWRAVEAVEKSGLMAAANMYLRSAWYVDALKNVVDSGELGELAVVRICHMTPGLSPGEGHEAEGPAFHDCGMHYVDLVRLLSGSDFKTMRSQAVRMWAYKDPWWLQCQGTMENGVVYDVTQSHAYGQLSAEQTHNSYIDILGSKGIARMHHDFKTAVVEIHGKNLTQRIEKDYGGKNIERTMELLADSIEKGEQDARIPSFRDSAIASEFAWKCLEDARNHDLPVKGTAEELEQIHQRRNTMTDGYGLLHKQTHR